MAGVLKRVAPHSYEAWIDYDVCGARLSRMELDVLRKLIKRGEGTLEPRATAPLGTAELESAGLGKREIRELFDKLASDEVPDFELDLSQAQSAESFAERFARAVPKVDKAPTE
jgi:hypothetical protein